jgi:hypothetical protein
MTAERLTTPSASVQAPLFLVGAQRSGTTLLRLMLDHHPEIAFEKEFDFAVTKVSETGQFPSLYSYLDWLRTVRGADYVIREHVDYRELVSDFLRQKQAAAGGKPYVGATVHSDFDRLRFLWPEARYIHLIRDPRDVARSVVQKGWAGNLYQGAESWIEAETCWDSLVPHLMSDQAVEIHYEDLVLRTDVVLGDICRFVGVEYSEMMLDYRADAPQYPPPDPTLVGQWKTKLAPREVAIVELRTERLMKSRGYARSGYPLPKVGRLRHEALIAAARLQGLRARVDLYGARLVTIELIGRRLGLRRLAAHAVRRMNSVEQHLIDQEAAGERAPSANMAPIARR